MGLRKQPARACWTSTWSKSAAVIFDGARLRLTRGCKGLRTDEKERRRRALPRKEKMAELGTCCRRENPRPRREAGPLAGGGDWVIRDQYSMSAPWPPGAGAGFFSGISHTFRLLSGARRSEDRIRSSGRSFQLHPRTGPGERRGARLLRVRWREVRARSLRQRARAGHPHPAVLLSPRRAGFPRFPQPPGARADGHGGRPGSGDDRRTG